MHSSHPAALLPQCSYERRRPEESVLNRTVEAGLEAFLARARSRDRIVPRFVERAFRGFLRCGILAHGFLRVHYDSCGHDRLAAFSCKKRGVCPSCEGRRMAELAAHLVEEVFPEAPVRQWVLTLPFALRYRPLPPPSSRSYSVSSKTSSARSGVCWRAVVSVPRPIPPLPTRCPRHSRCWPSWPPSPYRDGPLLDRAPACGLAAWATRSIPRSCRGRFRGSRRSTARRTSCSSRSRCARLAPERAQSSLLHLEHYALAGPETPWPS